MKLFLSLVSVLTILTLTESCTSKINTIPDPGNTNQFQELVVPSGFNWKMTQDVKCIFKSSERIATVQLFMPSENNPFTTFYVGANTEPVIVRLPATVSSVNVKYKNANGISSATTLTITNGILEYTVPNDCIEELPTERPVAVKSQNYDDDQKNPYFTDLYPAKGMATMMFEDLWPSLGDYDLNDIVMNYKIGKFIFNSNSVLDVSMKLRICAVGGSLPYNVYVELKDVTAGEIDLNYMNSDWVTDHNHNGTSKPKVTLINAEAKDQPAIFEISGLRNNKNRVVEYPYLNTVKGSEISKDKMIECEFIMPFINMTPLSKVETSKICLFIAKTETDGLKEIHIGGQEPTVLGKAIYEIEKAGNPNTNNSENYYYSNKRIIWGIDIPEEIPHAYEGLKFLEAYPNFTNWVQSGGDTNKNWYNNESGNRNESLLIKYIN